jgi:hypothetical protein
MLLKNVLVSLPLWIQERIEFVVGGIESRVKSRVEHEGAVQVDVVFIAAAMIFHAPWVDGMDKQNTRRSRIELGHVTFNEAVHHRRADVTFHAVFAGGEDEDFLVLFSRWRVDPVDGQAGVVRHGVLMQSMPCSTSFGWWASIRGNARGRIRRWWGRGRGCLSWFLLCHTEPR